MFIDRIQMYGLCILNKKAIRPLGPCPPHAACLLPCPGGSTGTLDITESCLPEVEGARHKARRAVIPLLKMPRTHTSIETENTLVVARHRGREDASDRARHRLSF